MRNPGSFRAALDDGVRLPPDPTQLRGRPLQLDVQCDDCENVWTERIEQVFMDPRVAGDKKRDAGWDGILLSKVVACARCGATDRYRLTGDSYAVLTVENLRALAGIHGARVTLAGSATWDGRPVHRASEGIKRLRRLAEGEPNSGEGWRRLGNFLKRFGAPSDEVIAAWRRAIAVDPEEVEAAYSLAKAAAGARSWFDFEDAIRELLSRLRHSRGRPRRLLAVGAADLLRQATGGGAPARALEAAWSAGRTRDGDPVVHVSSVSLAAVHDWEALEDFLAGRDLIAGHLTPDLPEATPTLLERELRGTRDVVPRRPPPRQRRKAKRKRKLARTSRKRNR
jgi:hypothetical protein